MRKYSDKLVVLTLDVVCAAWYCGHVELARSRKMNSTRKSRARKRQGKRAETTGGAPRRSIPPGKRAVKSMLGEMQDGREYASLVDCIPVEMDLADEFTQALNGIEASRGRPALLYAGNLISTQASPYISISNFDELPFAEMVDAVPPEVREVDVIVVTPGGSAQSVSYFVDKLRSRFDHVGFLIPYACMSAGTILVLSGDEIWMDERAYLGPIDAQSPASERRGGT